MDHQVPLAITAGLRRRAVDVLTAQEDGTEQWDDDRLLERSTQLKRSMFSQDEDLLVIAHKWQKMAASLPDWSSVHSWV